MMHAMSFFSSDLHGKKNTSNKKYSSIRTAARQLKVNHATLLNYINKDKLFKGKYMIKRVNKKNDSSTGYNVNVMH